MELKENQAAPTEYRPGRNLFDYGGIKRTAKQLSIAVFVIDFNAFAGFCWPDIVVRCGIKQTVK